TGSAKAASAPSTTTTGSAARSCSAYSPNTRCAPDTGPNRGVSQAGRNRPRACLATRPDASGDRTRVRVGAELVAEFGATATGCGDAAANAVGDRAFAEDCERCGGRAALRCHPLAQDRQRLIGARGEFGGSAEGREGEFTRLSGRQSDGAAGEFELFHEIEDIGRAAAADGGDRIEQRLLL